jgi:A/G-specific adenine glycosylase
MGTAPELPRKTPKKAQPVRFGIVYVARRHDGAFLMERRPDHGLLGGMLGWPGSDWTEGTPQHSPPVDAQWQILDAEARHTFTHFHLRLEIRVASLPLEALPERGKFLDPAAFRPSDLPTVMRKVFDLVRGSFDTDMT